jgi:clan AA aspartic protease (TIGR02281 family)
VSYSHLGQSAFTVTGISNGRYFYERFYADSSGAAGFTLTWTKEVSDRGTILATYLASFSKPLDHGTIGLGVSPAPRPPPGANSIPVPPAAPRQTEVQLQARGGTFLVPVLINNTLPLQFMVDSGASDVSIPADVVLTLVRTGTVTQSDFTGSQTYTTADGRSLPSQTFRIRSLRVGDKVAKNVDALVAPVEGELLLGESFLSRFSSWSIDNSRHVLVLGSLREQGVGDGSNAGTAYAPTQPPPPEPSAAAPERSAESPATARLALYGGLDFYGNDIFKGRVADAVHCAATCLGERQCQAFTFNANPHIHSGPNCFLKGSVNHLEAYSTAIGGLFLQSGQSAPQYTFDAIDPTTDLMVNRDLPGGDLSNYPYAPAKTLDNCRMACDDNQQCQAFS